MDETPTVVIPTVNNLSGSSDGPSGGGDWWSDEDIGPAALRLDGSDGGLWSGSFVPPPPRPLFLDESATPDGLTTCDLCSWAWQDAKSYTLDTALEAPGELGWVLTLVIVSLISAFIGAIVMIIVLHCKRMKNTGLNATELVTHRQTSIRNGSRPPISTPDDKTITTITPAHFPSAPANLNMTNNGVWSWLSRRSATAPSQLNSPTAPAENHYTHMEENYNGVGEALYAELDRESTSDSPAYQNSAYTDPDAPVSSAPSSAYYSDLSVTTVPERAYEVVGLSTLSPLPSMWDNSESPRHRQPPTPARLASISETITVPSDYV